MDLRIEVFGEEQQILRLESIPPKIGGPILERALVAGTLLPVNAAKEGCPKLTGNLSRSIHIGGHQGLTGGLRGSTGTHGGTSGSDIGGNHHSMSYAEILAGTNVEYADPVENGSGPHIIRAKDAGALFWAGAAHPVKEVNHPGAAPQPFMRPAFDGSGMIIAAEMAAVLRPIVESV